MASKAKARAKTIGLWLLTILLALLFGQTGVGKFAVPAWADMFARWGYSDMFRYLIGVLEILGAIGLLIPRTASYAATGLIGIMIGGIVTHVLHGEIQWASDLLFAVLLSVLAYARRPTFLRKPQTASVPSDSMKHPT